MVVEQVALVVEATNSLNLFVAKEPVNRKHLRDDLRAVVEVLVDMSRCIAQLRWINPVLRRDAGNIRDRMLSAETTPNFEFKTTDGPGTAFQPNVQQRLSTEEACNPHWAVATEEIVDEIEISSYEFSCNGAPRVRDIPVPRHRSKLRLSAKDFDRFLNSVWEKFFVRQAARNYFSITTIQCLPETFSGPRVRFRDELDSRIVVALNQFDGTVSRRSVLDNELDIAVGLI